MSNLAQDSFTGTAGTPLTADTPEIGGPWVVTYPGSSGRNTANVQLDGVGGCYITSNGDANLDIGPTVSAFDASFTVVQYTGTISGYLALRFGPSNSTRVIIIFYTHADQIAAKHFDASNTLTDLATDYIGAITYPATLRVTRSLAGLYKVYLNGTQVLADFTDTTVTSAKVGLAFHSDTAPSVSTGKHVANYVLTDPTAGGGTSTSIFGQSIFVERGYYQ